MTDPIPTVEYRKVALLIMSSDRTRFLVCQKAPENETDQYIMPGGHWGDGHPSNDGKVEPTATAALAHEMDEELACTLDEESVRFVGTYRDRAAGRSDAMVTIHLFDGALSGDPTPSGEIKRLHWIGAADAENAKVSAIIRAKIIPDLVQRGMLIVDK